LRSVRPPLPCPRGSPPFSAKVLRLTNFEDKDESPCSRSERGLPFPLPNFVSFSRFLMAGCCLVNALSLLTSWHSATSHSVTAPLVKDSFKKGVSPLNRKGSSVCSVFQRSSWRRFLRGSPFLFSR